MSETCLGERDDCKKDLYKNLEEIKDQLRQEMKYVTQNIKLKSSEELNTRRSELILSVEEVILQLFESTATGKPPNLFIRKQSAWDHRTFVGTVTMKPSQQAKMTTVRFGDPKSRRKFALIFRLLSDIHKLLLTDTTSTRRELYYQDVKLARSQIAVDAAMRDICCLLDACPWELGVVPTSKGLVAGSLVIVTADNEHLDCSAHSEGLLIPQNVTNIVRMETTSKFILIVEKDATFQKLIAEDFLKLLGPCILITGKGFPDMNTRLLVRRLWETFGLPTFVLTDADPHGIEIMCVYRFGSLRMCHEAEFLATPAVRWLGVHPRDVETLGMDASPLSRTDKDKLRHLSERPYTLADARLSRQVDLQLESGVKAEIEGMARFSQCYLTDSYIPTQITGRLFI
uniref:DNA topoisomerase (ATP-hydrolyzing) n=2 Tax=Timema TaxID=61471 RepID=A0A7R9E9K4_9NEOP|nr:unnamed protein product [Timema monikensis]